MSYTISSTLNKNRVFILQKSELEKRLDPFYYSSLNKLTILENTKLPKKKLAEVAELKRGKFSHRPRNDERFFGGQYPFIQTGEIVKASNSSGKIEYSQTLNELGLSVSKLFDEDVLLITIAANIGDTAILDYPACFPDSIVAILPKNKDVSLKYLNVYFKFLKKYLENLAPSAAQKNLTLEQLAPTPVVLPTIINQKKIVAIFDNYAEQKQQNEAAAKKLLASIDDYLLKELGINLPAPPENTLKNRMFATSISELSGNRFDPFYNNIIYAKIDNEIKGSKFLLSKFKDIFLPFRGVTFSANDIVENGLKVLRANNIDLKTNELLFNDVMNVSNEIEFNINQKLYKNDILMSAASGSKEHVGKVAFIKNDIDFYYGGFMMVLRNKRINNHPKYLFEFLQSKIFRTYVFRYLGGTNINNLNFEMIKELSIPIPPLSKQQEIAAHITAIRQQAQQLKDQTKLALAQANKQIEEILLG